MGRDTDTAVVREGVWKGRSREGRVKGDGRKRTRRGKVSE